jgi:hypothetical protein
MLNRNKVTNVVLTLAFVLLPQLASAQTNTFPSSGNAGVGTTTPATALEVRGDAVNSRVTATGTTGANGKFQLFSADIANNPFAEMQLVAPTGAGSEYLRFNIKNSSGSTFADALTLNRFGSVGIGTATPGGPIDVRDSSGRQILWNMSPQGHSFLSANGGNVHVAGNLYFNGTNWNRFNPAAPGGMWWAGSDGTLGVLQVPAGANPVGAFNWNFFIGATGNVGIGTAAPTNLLHVNSGAAPSSQFRLSANNAGSLSALSHAPDNAALGFDVDWSTGTGWIARHSTIAMLYKLGGKLQVMGWTGATVGSPIPDTTVHTSLDLTTGRFGIGVANPAYKLDVQGGQINSSGGLCIAGDCKTAWSQVGGGGSSQWIGTSSIHYNVGNVGIGTATPANKFEVVEANSPTAASIRVLTGSASAYGAYAIGRTATDGYWGVAGVANNYSNGSVAGDVVLRAESNLILGNSQSPTVYLKSNGNVGIGNTAPTEKLHVTGNGKFTGNLTVDGNINAKYQDLAEWVPSSEQLASGTVVVLDTNKSNQVISSTQSYDTRVAGVISAQPGITLGESGEGKVLVATTGRVRVKVDASRAPIQIGDLLVTSDIAGVAMKSEPVNLGGVQIHRPGTIVGKALEPLARGKGEILVLLSLQ